MKNIEKIKEILKELLKVQRLAVLSTQREGQPHGSLVAFAASDDLKEILFATPRTTRKYANLMADPRAALSIDNRSNLEADFRVATAVTATGAAREVLDEKRQACTQLYLSRHPPVGGFREVTLLCADGAESGAVQCGPEISECDGAASNGMRWVLSLHDVQDGDRHKVGGKCFALSRLARKGFNVPETICVTTDSYETYVDATGLRERILMELNRKAFRDMRAVGGDLGFLPANTQHVPEGPRSWDRFPGTEICLPFLLG